MPGEPMSLDRETLVTASAVRTYSPVDTDGLLPAAAWSSAPPICFAHDWRGANSDPQRETGVRVLWSAQHLFFRFVARYRNICVFPDAEPTGRRDELWERDVVEVFLQPPEFTGKHYKEFEVSPNGFWIDLDIMPQGRRFLESGLHRRTRISEAAHTWEAELAIPIKRLTANFDPKQAWRVNFFRVEGATEPRFYSAWRPTGTAVPNFHVPEAFGQLVFEP
jgi:alpha-galactosidase